MMTASVPYTSALSSRVFFFFSSRRRHTRCSRDWSSDVCSSDLAKQFGLQQVANAQPATSHLVFVGRADAARGCADFVGATRYFSRFIQFSVVRKDQVRTIADVQPPVHVHAGVCKGFHLGHQRGRIHHHACADDRVPLRPQNSAGDELQHEDRKSTRLNSSHGYISYAVFCLKKKKKMGVRGWLSTVQTLMTPGYGRSRLFPSPSGITC